MGPRAGGSSDSGSAPPSANTGEPAALPIGSAEVFEVDYSAAVYGSLLVTTLIAVQLRHEASVSYIALSLVASVGVFWLAHVWSAIVSRRVHGRIERSAVLGIARSEGAMLWAAVLPALALGFARLGAYTVDAATSLALLVSIVQLFVWGLAVGRAAHTSWALTLGIAAVDCSLGIVVVVLKVIVIH